MKVELQNKLFNKYPEIFVNKYKSPHEFPMAFGIETDDGWFWLLDGLCESIQSYITLNNKSQIRAMQVKEKFGGLKFYHDGGYGYGWENSEPEDTLEMDSSEYIDGMISVAEYLSGTICEICGTTKEIGRTVEWIKTICQTCHNVSPRSLQKWVSISRV